MKNTPESVPFSVHESGVRDVISSFTGDVNLDLLLKVTSARFLHCKVILFPFVIKTYQGVGEIL